MGFQNFIRTIGDRITAKRYMGLLPGNLPVSSARWEGADFLNANEVSLYTNRAIAKRADKVGEIEFLLQDKAGNQITNDETLSLLSHPNSLFSGVEFWKLYQKYYDTVGEAYIYLERTAQFGARSKVTALHLLNPTMVRPFFNPDGSVDRYEYKTQEGDTVYGADDVLYIHNPNPKQPLRGISLLKAGINAIQTETQISTYHSRILENGGKVEGVFKFKTGPLTKEQLETIKSRYQKEYGAAKKAGLPLFLGGDADYIKTGLSPEELSFLEAKRMTLEDICILTGVPKSMLASTADVKFDNADADRAIFLRETIKPLLRTLAAALDRRLFPDDRELTFIDPTPENIDQKLKETESGIRNYYMTINEARERHGLDPIENGNDIMIPFSMMPLGAEPEPVAEKRYKGESDHPLKDADVRAIYGRMQIKRLDARERPFKKAVEKYFDEQETRIVEILQPTKTRVFRKKSLMDELLSLELEVKIGKEKFMPLLIDLLQKSGGEAMDMAGSNYEFVLSAEIQGWIENRADIFLRSINETTFNKLRDVFAESLAAEEGREKLIARIQDAYNDQKKARAATIARTEVHNATQYGTMQGYKQGGLTIKIWVAVMDAATRDSHVSLDGEERPIDRPFSNGLMYPGDPRGDASETINCRCVI